ncbi:hypothetical protein Tdes44962_MAKER01398 [Teratosphaeria destructans]|uniref:Uncharacterized protein n=1 Tax=Teratosphaeria destructans TaxID=418781 RepID=A0A9W7W6P6_9PEZI|nr:hypothetical protein Tdes44962_MAKER01398 [Teratosphaeria destructans]
MKASANVQGLKSLVEAIHPQLPLTSKESNRLLTALTSSFRKHLDEVHQPKAIERGKHITSNASLSAPKVNHNPIHSSATLADKHLASVLTNPLLATGPHAVRTPEQEYASAKLELQMNPSKDPITLLEEYQDRCAATVAIARLCLEVFRYSIESLPEAAQQNAIADTAAGRRVLLWLCLTESFEEHAFVDDKHFIKLLVELLIREGHDKYIWDLLELDQTLATDGPLRSLNSSKDKTKHHVCHWKGRLLAAMVEFHVSEAGRKTKDFNKALDTLFKGGERILQSTDHTKWLPLKQAQTIFERALWKDSRRGGPSIDPHRLERYIEHIKSAEQDDISKTRLLYRCATLWLVHPTQPSPKAALLFFRNVERNMGPNSDPIWRRAARSFASPLTWKTMLHFYWAAIRTISLLKLHERNKDADWLESLIRQTYPRHAQEKLELDCVECMRIYRDREHDSSTQRDVDATAGPARVPLPRIIRMNGLIPRNPASQGRHDGIRWTADYI